MEHYGKLLVFFFAVLICINGFVVADNECVYTIFVSTGTQDAAATDSNISAKLFNAYGEVLTISNLETWGGLMGSGHNYFEKGNLDIFSGRGTCFYSPICGLNLTSSGTGPYPDWFCNYVSVTYTGANIQCHQQKFDVSQWIAVNTAPYELSITRNNCNVSVSHKNPTASASSRFRSNNILLFPKVAY